MKTFRIIYDLDGRRWETTREHWTGQTAKAH